MSHEHEGQQPKLTIATTSEPSGEQAQTLPLPTVDENVKQAQELINILIERIQKENLEPDGIEVEAALKAIKEATGSSLKRLWTSLKKQVGDFKASMKSDAQPEQEATVFSNEEIEAGRLLSLEPNIYLKHREAFKKLGYCGKDHLKDTAMTSSGKRLLSKCAAHVATGGSASGKSELWDKEEKFLPPEYIVSFTSMSENALYYMGGLEHKVLKIGELPPRKPNELEDTPQWSALRQLISEGELTRAVPVKQPDGTIKLEKLKTKGPCSIWASTTRGQQDFNDELVNRCSWIQSDESEATTRDVNAEQGKRDEKPYDYSEEDESKITRVWQAFNASLKAYPVIIPYAHHLHPNPKYLTARRLYPQIRNDVRVSTLYHQHTREKEIHKGKEYLASTIADYENIFEQINSNAPKVFDVVSQVALDAFLNIRGQLIGKKVTVADLMKLLSQTDPTTRRYRTQYLKAGLLELCEEKKGKAELVMLGKVWPEQIESMALGIITPQKLKEEIAKCPDCSAKLKESLNELPSDPYSLSHQNERQCTGEALESNFSPNFPTFPIASNDSERMKALPGQDNWESFNFSSNGDREAGGNSTQQ